jgi:hypothetical protein
MAIRQRTLDVTTFGIEPAVVGVLSKSRQHPTHHNEYGFRPPAGIYNVSLGEIVGRANEVVEEVTRVVQHRPFDPQSFEDSLPDKQLLLLHAVMQHMDDCMNLLKCYFPAEIPFEKNTPT